MLTRFHGISCGFFFYPSALLFDVSWGLGLFMRMDPTRSLWCSQSADACGGSWRGESLWKSCRVEAELVIAVSWGLKLFGRASSCASSVGWPWGGSFCSGQLSTLSLSTSREGLGSGCRSGGCQTTAKATSRRGKMSPSETIKLVNKTLCLCECLVFFSVCLGSATLTSWPYRGAAEGMRLIVQETSALANFCSNAARPRV